MQADRILDKLLTPAQEAGSRVDQVLDNGLTAGTIAAVLMTWFAEFTSPRPSRMETALNDSALREIDAFLIDAFLKEISANNGWDDTSADRLCAAGEETLFSLLSADDANEPAG
jgi:hypothetical protein